ncbi:hypothetical protein CcaverHIS002_0703740 [Cutaneotrichosporon cavernicola]|uniref:Uncharacterized protein n=1 Tax=Cutaneotrichosporon cavernicola TaxID=279322 RepID=A0AA48QYW7_9TREE|nr:uncharacterized protein CcaverHIS019_0703820 [Cutaneotrichosporon cavernicola]BEI87028.1 hypothetical protein CcaverHIS002_0703740 [Cutaneotrichosporon cavernicola]BEI94801.1 hypothetical protein CcaverHIS019_0703820 [Cutaneotrichosporon cavernicola]BEJ02576.1 hypothetical protein CcaverHIS631_0703710 [Cutaneotrichosporon cavernicola]BEJ10332.1 hypothetical protein CcaverHIS641_0703670 [Cutaneotrichosporon cavernicola]
MSFPAQGRQPVRPARSTFRMPGRAAPSPPVGVEPASARIPHLPLQLGPLPNPPLQRHPTVPARASASTKGHVARSSLSNTTPTYTPHYVSSYLSSQLSAQQLNQLAAQQLSTQQSNAQTLIVHPPRHRSLSIQSYHALMPEHAAVTDLAVPEEDETDLPYSRGGGELAVRADHTGRRCSVIAITPSVGRKAKCHYDPFARRHTLMQTTSLADMDGDSVLSSYSSGGASGVFVRSEGSHWTVVDEGSVRSLSSARIGQLV